MSEHALEQNLLLKYGTEPYKIVHFFISPPWALWDGLASQTSPLYSSFPDAPLETGS